MTSSLASGLYPQNFGVFFQGSWQLGFESRQANIRSHNREISFDNGVGAQPTPNLIMFRPAQKTGESWERSTTLARPTISLYRGYACSIATLASAVTYKMTVLPVKGGVTRCVFAW